MNVCRLCRKAFSTAWNLSRHDAQVHPRPSSTSYVHRSSVGEEDEPILMLQSQPQITQASSNSVGLQHPEIDYRNVQAGCGILPKYSERLSVSTDEGGQSSGSDGEEDKVGVEVDRCGCSGLGGSASSCSGVISADDDDSEFESLETVSEDDCESDVSGTQNSSDGDVDGREEESGLSETESEDVRKCDTSITSNSGDECFLDGEEVESQEEELEYVGGGPTTTTSRNWDSSATDMSANVEHGNFACWKIGDETIYLPWKTIGKKPLVHRHKAWLSKLLIEEKGRRRRICAAQHSQIDAIREISRNVLQGCVPMTAEKLRSLKLYKRTLRTLSSESVGYGELKRSLLGARKVILPLVLWIATPTSTRSRHNLFHK